MKDYYGILGISKNATADEIKSAYRKLAMKYHPDRNPGNKAAEEKFKEITAAYEILGDENKRRQYDMYGSSNAYGSSSSQTWGHNQEYSNSAYGSGMEDDPFWEWMNGNFAGQNSRSKNSHRRYYYYTNSNYENKTSSDVRTDNLASIIKNVLIFLVSVYLLKSVWWLFFPILPLICIVLMAKSCFGFLKSIKNLIS